MAPASDHYDLVGFPYSPPLVYGKRYPISLCVYATDGCGRDDLIGRIEAGSKPRDVKTNIYIYMASLGYEVISGAGNDKAAFSQKRVCRLLSPAQ